MTIELNENFKYVLELDKEMIRIKGQYRAKYGRVMDEFEAILYNEMREIEAEFW